MIGGFAMLWVCAYVSRASGLMRYLEQRVNTAKSFYSPDYAMGLWEFSEGKGV